MILRDFTIIIFFSDVVALHQHHNAVLSNKPRNKFLKIQDNNAHSNCLYRTEGRFYRMVIRMYDGYIYRVM